MLFLVAPGRFQGRSPPSALCRFPTNSVSAAASRHPSSTTRIDWSCWCAAPSSSAGPGPCRRRPCPWACPGEGVCGDCRLPMWWPPGRRSHPWRCWGRWVGAALVMITSCQVATSIHDVLRRLAEGSAVPERHGDGPRRLVPVRPAGTMSACALVLATTQSTYFITSSSSPMPSRIHAQRAALAPSIVDRSPLTWRTR